MSNRKAPTPPPKPSRKPLPPPAPPCKRCGGHGMIMVEIHPLSEFIPCGLCRKEEHDKVRRNQLPYPIIWG